jgi:hypothetical protein
MTVSTNTYSIDFSCKDPETKLPVRYTFTVKTKPQIVVRAADMLIAVDRLASKAAYPEELADKLKSQFPGEHMLKANHLGVDVVTTRQGAA